MIHRQVSSTVGYLIAIMVAIFILNVPRMAWADNPPFELEGIKIETPFAPNPSLPNETIKGTVGLHFFAPGTQIEIKPPTNCKITWHLRSLKLNGDYYGNGSNVAFNPFSENPAKTGKSILTVNGLSTAGNYVVTIFAVVESTLGGPPWQPVTSEDFPIQLTVDMFKIISVNIVNDHGVLLNKNDTFKSGGTRFPNIEWQIGNATSAPVDSPSTVTWNTKIQLVMTVQAAGGAPSGNVDISGAGLGDYSDANQPLPAAGGTKSYTITATNNDSDHIGSLTSGVTWTLNQAGTQNVLLTQQTGPNVVYTLAGAPQTDSPTLKRVAWAVGIANGAKDIMTAAGDFQDKIFATPGPNGTVFKGVTSTVAWQEVNDKTACDCISLSNICVTGLGVLHFSATIDWAYPTLDGTNTAGWNQVVTVNSCTKSQLLFKTISFFQGKFIFPGANNFEGFFKLSDPNNPQQNIYAYSVWPEHLSTNIKYYRLEIASDSFQDQLWVWNESATRNGIKVKFGDDAGEPHVAPPAIPNN